MNKEALKTSFEKNGYSVKFFDTKEEATQYLCGEIKDTTVATGGSMTLAEMGLLDALSANNKIYDHSNRSDIEKLKEELTAEVFICSANGVAETGEMVNIDGTGNRLAGTLFGHARMYYVIGKNKIAKDLAGAIDHAKNVASPKNCVRLLKKTPCTVTGKCEDCNSPERICRATVIYDRAVKSCASEVIFIDEELGY